MALTACSDSDSDAPETETETRAEDSGRDAPDAAAEAVPAADASKGTAASKAGLQPEAIGRIETLPEKWPANWIIAQDVAFFHMSDGKFIVLDIAEDEPAAQFKGMFNGSKIANFAQSTTRPEMYIVETFLSRGQRGERTDVLTIIDKKTLAPVAEVIVPPKRMSVMPTQYALQLTDNESKALVFNLTPATSVSVVDLDKRELLSELPVPGCAGAYPTGKNGFSSLCADGTIYSIALNAAGNVASSARTDKFNDIDDNALFERAAIHDGIGYFPTFMGDVVPVDLTGSAAVVWERWSLVGDEEGDWRPGGIQLAAIDAAGRLYVLMHPRGYEGSHKDPGVEIWVFDPQSKSRLARIVLQTPVLSISVTRDADPLIVATNVEMNIDVYASDDGTTHQDCNRLRTGNSAVAARGAVDVSLRKRTQ